MLRIFCDKSISVVFLLLSGAQAARANILVFNFAVNLCRDLMHVGFEAALCLFVRVTDVISGNFAFAANRTNSAHV